VVSDVGFGMASRPQPKPRVPALGLSSPKSPQQSWESNIPGPRIAPGEPPCVARSKTGFFFKMIHVKSTGYTRKKSKEPPWGLLYYIPVLSQLVSLCIPSISMCYLLPYLYSSSLHISQENINIKLDHYTNRLENKPIKNLKSQKKMSNSHW